MGRRIDPSWGGPIELFQRHEQYLYKICPADLDISVFSEALKRLMSLMWARFSTTDCHYNTRLRFHRDRPTLYLRVVIDYKSSSHVCP